MSNVKVYRFKKYDITTDQMQMSRRMATPEAIDRIGGEIIKSECLEVTPENVGGEYEGMTDRGFWLAHSPNPHALRNGMR